jgi:hypothetical protein
VMGEGRGGERCKGQKAGDDMAGHGWGLIMGSAVLDGILHGWGGVVTSRDRHLSQSPSLRRRPEPSFGAASFPASAGMTDIWRLTFFLFLD